jgi:alkylation response protein AidB-like acyl-CoA dehydrogenase
MSLKAKKIEKLGMHSSDTGLIHFDDVRVPASNVIGDEGNGFIYQMLQFQVNSVEKSFSIVPFITVDV